MEEHPAVRTFTTAVAVLAVVWAYFAAPLLAFADAAVLAVAGGAMGIGAGVAWLALMQGWGRRWEWPALAAATFGLLLVGWQVSVASQTYSANEQRCVSLQRDMLSAAPRRADEPAIFEALHCHPSGTEPFSLGIEATVNRGALPQKVGR